LYLKQRVLMSHNHSIPPCCYIATDQWSGSFYHKQLQGMYSATGYCICCWASSSAVSLSVFISDCEVLVCNWTVQRAAGSSWSMSSQVCCSFIWKLRSASGGGVQC